MAGRAYRRHEVRIGGCDSHDASVGRRLKRVVPFRVADVAVEAEAEGKVLPRRGEEAVPTLVRQEPLALVLVRQVDLIGPEVAWSQPCPVLIAWNGEDGLIGSRDRVLRHDVAGRAIDQSPVRTA
ncbi:hypothetical protein D3C71_919640 [compost metagenome]